MCIEDLTFYLMHIISEQFSHDIESRGHPMLWRTTVEKVLVKQDDTVTFIMAGGKEYGLTIY